MTASFLPKPVVGVNGSGMHTNVSISKDGKNLFWDPDGKEKLSDLAWQFIGSHSKRGQDICLMLNSQVNSYRRLDPHFEAPNQIKASAVDRGSMIRIPIGNERSARVEVRSVAPGRESVHGDARGLQDGPRRKHQQRSQSASGRTLSARQHLRRARGFRNSPWTGTMLGDDVKERYADLKQASADRCARLLGTMVKAPEVQFHHEVYNQFLWNLF